MKPHRALGVATVAAGAVLLLVDTPFDVGVLTGRYVHVVFGALTAATGLAFLFRAHLGNDGGWDPAPIERGILVPRPGDDLLSAGEPAIRGRFRLVAAEALVRDGYAPEEAETALAEGTWTHNTDAAAYLRARPEELPDGDVLERQRAATLDELERVRHRDHD